MVVYSVDENLTPVLLTAMRTCFMFHLLVLRGIGLGLVTAGLDYITGLDRLRLVHSALFDYCALYKYSYLLA